jgi:prepilin-type N-terminal cleavage/methylation domain-containing protein
MARPRIDAESGFSLIEVIVAMGIMLVVLAGTFAAMTNAMESENTAKQITNMNSNLRASMDLMVRDMLQVGQGLPVGRRVGVPNGPGSNPIVRPGPPAVAPCAGVANFPAGPTLPAVSVGPDLGPPVNGQCTDVITTLAADGAFENANVSSIAADGTSLTIHPAGPDGVMNTPDDTILDDDPDVGGNNVRPGDLLIVVKGVSSVLMQVTGVAGQTVTFGGGAADPLGLNQFDPALNMLGTINQHKAQPTPDPDVPVVNNGVQQTGPSVATRVRMITYFIDTATDPVNPRLVRIMGGGQPNAVGFEIESFRVTYDLADGVTNPTGVRMVAADLAAGGACGLSPCSENQIRKANLVLAMRSDQRTPHTGDFYRNTLFTQVSLRSLAFVDRYR